jgi:hypothetical protein
MSKLTNITVTPVMTAAAVTLAQALILGVAYFASSGQANPNHAWLIPIVAALGGVMAFIFHKRGWYAILMAFLVGLVIGDIGALDVANQPVEQLYAVSAATVGFFAALGLLVGTVAELVRFVHFLIHGGKLKCYPRGCKPEENKQKEG